MVREEEAAFIFKKQYEVCSMNWGKAFISYTVRQLTEQDIPDVYVLCKSNPVYYEYMKLEPTLENLAEAMRELPPGKSMKDKYFMGFFRDNHLLAILDLIMEYPDEKTAFIGWFMVKKEYQKAGTGSAIIEELLSLLKKEGCIYARLGYIKGNRQSENFWKKSGFEAAGTETKTDQYTIVTMQRTL